MHDLTLDFPAIASLQYLGQTANNEHLEALVVRQGSPKATVIIEGGIRGRFGWIEIKNNCMITFFSMSENGFQQWPLCTLSTRLLNIRTSLLTFWTKLIWFSCQQLIQVWMKVFFVEIMIFKRFSLKDGYEYSQEVDRTWVKNRRAVSSSCVGVDINRNFPYHFTGDSNVSFCNPKSIWKIHRKFFTALRSKPFRTLCQFRRRNKGDRKTFVSFWGTRSNVFEHSSQRSTNFDSIQLRRHRFIKPIEIDNLGPTSRNSHAERQRQILQRRSCWCSSRSWKRNFPWLCLRNPSRSIVVHPEIAIVRKRHCGKSASILPHWSFQRIFGVCTTCCINCLKKQW